MVVVTVGIGVLVMVLLRDNLMAHWVLSREGSNVESAEALLLVKF